MNLNPISALMVALGLLVLSISVWIGFCVLFALGVHLFWPNTNIVAMTGIFMLITVFSKWVETQAQGVIARITVRMQGISSDDLTSAWDRLKRDMNR